MNAKIDFIVLTCSCDLKLSDKSRVQILLPLDPTGRGGQSNLSPANVFHAIRSSKKDIVPILKQDQAY